jgi:type IV secretory pathway TrbD component
VVAERKRSKDTERSYPGERARQGDIVLRTSARRWIFIGGLVAAVVVAIVLTWLGLRH